MPLDSTSYSRIPVTAQRLLALADSLDQLPPDFLWDIDTYLSEGPAGECGCAIGLAVHIGMIDRNEFESWRADLCVANKLRRFLGLTTEQASGIFKIFVSDGPQSIYEHWYDAEDITPEMVAGELRKAAAEQITVIA